MWAKGVKGLILLFLIIVLQIMEKPRAQVVDFNQITKSSFEMYIYIFTFF